MHIQNNVTAIFPENNKREKIMAQYSFFIVFRPLHKVDRIIHKGIKKPQEYTFTISEFGSFHKTVSTETLKALHSFRRFYTKKFQGVPENYSGGIHKSKTGVAEPG